MLNRIHVGRKVRDKAELYLLDVFKVRLQSFLGDEVEEVITGEDVHIFGVDPRHAFHVQHLEPLEARQASGQRA